MEYIALDTFPHYKECSPLVEGLGFSLVELRTIPAKTQINVRVVIARKNDAESTDTGIGINDCAKIHRLIQPRLEALIASKDVAMEVTSPGMERNIKNAAEFILFKGLLLKVWDTVVSDWICGKIISANDHEVTLNMDNGEKKIIPYSQIAKAKLQNI